MLIGSAIKRNIIRKARDIRANSRKMKRKSIIKFRKRGRRESSIMKRKSKSDFNKRKNMIKC